LFAIFRQPPKFPVPPGVSQCRNQHPIEELFPSVSLDILFNDIRRFGLVHSQQPLIVADAGLQRRLIADQHSNKIHPWHVFAEHDNTDRKRGGKDQSDRSPKPSPESNRD
jgi:hypothetical protein